MSKVTKEELKALEGHLNRLDILEVLESPVEPYEQNDWHNGYLIQSMPDNVDTDCFDAPNYLTHTLDHWKGKQGRNSIGAPIGTMFKVDGFRRHEEAQKEARAQHGLEFLQRPHRKGPYVRMGPKTRKLVNEAYIRQHNEEWK